METVETLIHRRLKVSSHSHVKQCISKFNIQKMLIKLKICNQTYSQPSTSGCKTTRSRLVQGNCCQYSLDWCRRKWEGPLERWVFTLVLHDVSPQWQTDRQIVLFVFQLYSLFLTAAAGHLTARQSSAAAWADAMLAGTQAMKRLTKTTVSALTAHLLCYCNICQNIYPPKWPTSSQINCFRYGGADTGDRTMVSSQLLSHIPFTL